MIKRELNKEHGERLKECLDDAGMTQEELAEKANCTPQFISNVIKGKRNMSFQTAEIFAEILQVRSGYLLGTELTKTDKEIEKYERTSIAVRNNAILDILEETSNIRVYATIVVIKTPDGNIITDHIGVPELFLPPECIIGKKAPDIYECLFSLNDPHFDYGYEEIDIPDNSFVGDIQSAVAIVDPKLGTRNLKVVPYDLIFDLIYDIVDYTEYKCNRLEKAILSETY